MLFVFFYKLSITLKITLSKQCLGSIMAKFETIIEGKAKVSVPVADIVSKDLPVFYNPVMEFNRNTSVWVLNSLERKDLQACLPLAGSGIRAIRLLKETECIKNILINDYSKEAIKLIKKNLKSNKIPKTKATISCNDANMAMLESKGFDFIEIDPFGSPNKFLNSAVERIARDGILGVTATDTGALSGSYPDACKRKYWAAPLRDANMHETGLRILIRKVQLIGVQFEKALTPIYSYSKDHYMKVYFLCKKSKTGCDKLLEQHGMIGLAGPLWLGDLWDAKIAKNVYEQSKDPFAKLIADESSVPATSFYDIHDHVKKLKTGYVPKTEEIIKKIKKAGYKVAHTHFSLLGLRTNMPEKEFDKILKNIKV